MYVIVKQVEIQAGTRVPVILLDSNDEILEFDSQDEANRMKNLFEKNSTHGSTYVVKEL